MNHHLFDAASDFPDTFLAPPEMELCATPPADPDDPSTDPADDILSGPAPAGFTPLDLAKQIEKLRNRIDEIYPSVRSVAKKQALDKLDKRLGDQLIRLISINVKADGAEYEAATTALKSANRKLNAAIEDSEALADALGLITRALDLVARVVAL